MNTHYAAYAAVAHLECEVMFTGPGPPVYLLAGIGFSRKNVPDGLWQALSAALPLFGFFGSDDTLGGEIAATFSEC